jgi:tetratricopeptide (TPR) repeat protein
MLRTTWLWKGIGPLALGGILVTGITARADDTPPLSRQLTDLGRQAQAQGDMAQAGAFYRKALQLEPGNVEARRSLDALGTVRQVALQEPAPAPEASPAVTAPALAPAPAPAQGDTKATLEEANRAENIHRQQVTEDVGQRLKQARDLVNAGQPEAALDRLRLAQNVVRSDDQLDQATRDALDRQIQTQYMSTVRSEERIQAEQFELRRRTAMGDQQQRALDVLARNQQTVDAIMVQFDALMTQGMYNILYNGGTGDIIAATAPFGEARMLAQQARALIPNNGTPRAGMFVSQTVGFLSQELAFESLKEYRFMLTMQDVARASVPFPDALIIEYPPADRWRALSEKRRARYGKAVDLLARDKKTMNILAKLDEPIAMNFANETPLEDVLKYIKSATQGPNDSGIPIYVDPVGLQEAEKTLTSPITLDLEGVPLKTTLRLLLKQLTLTYTVKDGLLTITSESSNDQPTEIRVYPVADLAIIPISLMGGGGMGGMGGGMGGMGGGMGGMGGGMGGMGGGMGGGGMGGMGGGGMMSVPVQEPTPQPGAGYLEKKST